MGLHDQIDEAVRRLPEWVPPRHFASRTAALIDIHTVRMAARPRPLFWLVAAVEGAAAAVMAFVGSAVAAIAAGRVSSAAGAAVDEYVRIAASAGSSNVATLAWTYGV